MSDLKREHFELKKFKRTSAGIQLGYRQTIVLTGGVKSQANVTKTYKDDPHPDLLDALQAIDEIVMYDEDYKKGTEVKVTGVTIFPDLETCIITHVKTSVSGKAVKNSGRIAKDSENFQKAVKLFDLLDILENEVYEYEAEGKRSQLKLFDGKDEVEEEEEHLEAV
jgi:hypothetical protein